jgi:hypothetical protein
MPGEAFYGHVSDYTFWLKHRHGIAVDSNDKLKPCLVVF